VDGRSARSQRTREAVVDALLALLDEGHVQPSVEEIAARAGVSERTIFGHFHDREGLFEAVGERRAPVLRAAWGTLPSPSAPLEERIAAFADQRARIYELITPLRRAALLMEPFSPATQAGVGELRSLKRREAWRLFSPELHDDHVLGAAVAALASWSAWEALRTQQGLTVEEARAALARGLSALLR
jgi:TetR/AcrR family transcriptional regulator, regulator of autoinduction and epiphytic fitness